MGRQQRITHEKLYVILTTANYCLSIQSGNSVFLYIVNVSDKKNRYNSFQKLLPLITEMLEIYLTLKRTDLKFTFYLFRKLVNYPFP